MVCDGLRMASSDAVLTQILARLDALQVALQTMQANVTLLLLGRHPTHPYPARLLDTFGVSGRPASSACSKFCIYCSVGDLAAFYGSEARAVLG
jgi:hypothetical protein